MTMEPLEQGSLYDVYLPYMPEREELERLDSLLTEMLAKSQAELDRVSSPGVA
jgi:hypothetical protein